MKTKILVLILYLLLVYGAVICFSQNKYIVNKGWDRQALRNKRIVCITSRESWINLKKFNPENLKFDSAQTSSKEFTRPFKLDSCSVVMSCSFYSGNNLPNSGTGARFDSGISSSGDTFYCKADFRENKFNQKIDFGNSIFEDTAEFTYSEFGNETSFYQVTFLKNCHFVMAHINDEISFYEAKFGNVAFFSSLKFDAQLKGVLTFTQACLPDTIDFSDNQYLPRQIEFTDANFADGKMHYIYLNRTDISKIHIDYTHFRLSFSDPKDTSKILSDDERTASYEGLLKSFKDHGQTMSYELLDIEFKDWQSKHNFLMWLDGWWWNYGYAKGRVILWTFLFLFIFSVINVLLYDNLLETYNIQQLNKKNFAFSHNYFISGLQTYKLSLIYTTFIFSKLGIDFDKVKIKSWIMLFVIVIEYLTGLLCTGCLLNWVLSK